MNFILGGIAIGLGVSILLVMNGRILGISGIIREFVKHPLAEMGWRLFFIAGLLSSPWVYSRFFSVPNVEIFSDASTIIFSGFLMGLGASLANGCTSGHTICGIARFSKRSMVASIIIILAAMLSYHLAGLF
jgi:uncharacterized membrane protein YedE/YeeE